MEMTSTTIERGPRAVTRGLLPLALLLAAVALAAGYRATLVPVTLVVDGRERDVRTHQESVGALLVDAGLVVFPEDAVSPAPRTPVEPGLVVSVRRARAVLVSADGETRLVRTHATTADEVLREAGIPVGPYDDVELEGPLLLPEIDARDPGPARLTVRRAVSLLLSDAGNAATLYTTAPTVGEALYRAGLTLYLADYVDPGLDAPVSEGMQVVIDRSVPVRVDVDGQTLRTRTHRERVDEVLADLGVVLAGQDYALPPLDARLDVAAAAISVVRVGQRILIEQEPIPYQTVWQPDPDLELDQQRLLQDGARGILERRTRVRYENGQVVEREVEGEYVLAAPTTRIFGYGTKIVIRTLDTPQGPIEYWRVIHDVHATSYSASTAGTDKNAPWYGYTRTGEKMRHGIVAVDPDVINLRTYVYVEGYGVGYAADTGGWINGRRIDLGYDDDNLVLWYKYGVDVYLLTPVPDEIIYVIE